MILCEQQTRRTFRIASARLMRKCVVLLQSLLIVQNPCPLWQKSLFHCRWDLNMAAVVFETCLTSRAVHILDRFQVHSISLLLISIDAAFAASSAGQGVQESIDYLISRRALPERFPTTAAAYFSE